jgi:predicted acyltransferase
MRWRSVDALRGLAVAAMLVVNDPGDWSHVHPWLLHAPWHGLRPPDFVFPLFLFVVGVALGCGKLPAPRAAASRAARLVLLGLALHLVSMWLLTPERPLRWPGVLQRIGLAYGGAVLILHAARTARARAAAGVALLAAHAALLFAGGPLEPFVNIGDRIDTLLFGPHAYRFENGRAHDPEGLLGTLGAIASVLLGALAAAALRARRLQALALAGAALVVAGCALHALLPINKAIWTPSFVAVTGGAAALLLCAASAAFDREGRGWVPFETFGRQAITAYVLAWLAASMLQAGGVGGRINALLAAAMPAEAASAAYALLFTASIAVVVSVLHRLGWRWTL